MLLRGLAGLSAAYGVGAGALLLLLRVLGSAPPLPGVEPNIYADLNAVFLIAIGLGYGLPWRDPDRYRAYFWIFGVVTKSAGACVFVVHLLTNAAPTVYWLFVAADATFAALTLITLAVCSAGATRASPLRLNDGSRTTRRREGRGQ